jgi:LysM repeat protein
MRRIFAPLFVLVLAFSGLMTSAQEQTHTVSAGENLFRIALRYGVSLNELAQANNIANVNLIYVGTVLTIPGTTGGTTPPPADNGGDAGGDAGAPSGDTVQYTVVRGDSLGAIARRFGTTFQSIAQLNNIANPNLIFPGQVLTISGTPPANTPSTGNPVVNNPSSPPPNTAPITGFELGGHVFGFSYPDLMRGTGMTWAKIQVVWNQGEPPSIAQDEIDAAKSRGFKILLGIKGNPAQLAANPTQYYQDFANFVGGVAALGADAIEVWNEQNIDREWPSGLISGAQYTQMLSAAYQSIKANNPNTLVISGAPAPTGFFGGCSTAGCDDDRYIRAMAAAGASQFMDCVGIHYNSGITSPFATSGAPVGSSGHYSWYYPSMVNLYSSTFPGKPLCFTEIGYLTSEGYGDIPGGFSWAAGNTLANQVEWLSGAVQQARNSGIVRLFIVWNVDNTNWGADPQAGYAIVRPDGTCPACNAIAQVMQ